MAQGKKANHCNKNIWRSWFVKFQYDEERDLASDTRNVLLLIGALISAVTFQAGVNPPGGVWQDDKGHHAGRAIYACQQQAFYFFLISNTLALSTSLLVIVSLTFRLPLHFEIRLATASIIVTYASAIFAVTPRKSVKFRYLLVVAALPLLMRLLIQMLKKFTSNANEPVSGVEQEEDEEEGQDKPLVS